MIFAKSKFLLAFALLLIVIGGCSSSQSEKLVLVTGADPGHPYLQKQVSYLTEVLDSLGYELEVQRHQSAYCFELSNSGQVDGEMWRILGVDAEYQNLIRVPTGVWAHPELAFVKGNIELDGWKSLAPFRVAFRKGTKVVENNINGVVEDQVPLDTIEEAFQLLAKGAVDVVISDNIDGTLLLASDECRNSGIKLIEKPIDDALLFSYLHKKHAALVPKMAKAISDTKRDGTYQEIVGEPPVRD
jgi:polar amino acid transport system substrate-binding protein